METKDSKSYIQLNSIKVNSDNPRLIKKEKFAKLVASIKDFPKMMELRPIVVDKNMVILGGNMRYRALKEAGFKEIDQSWVKIADGLTEEEKRRFVIEDNVSDGDWDWEKLANEWDIPQLNEWGLDIANFNQPINPDEEWLNMPEFNQENLQAFKRVIINFSSQEDVNLFSNLIKQKITDKTRSLWYPYQKPLETKNKVYIEENDQK